MMAGWFWAEEAAIRVVGGKIGLNRGGRSWTEVARGQHRRALMSRDDGTQFPRSNNCRRPAHLYNAVEKTLDDTLATYNNNIII